ncbi:MAG: GNAT family N-acetyltransferase [Quadrisphaera sp.]
MSPAVPSGAPVEPVLRRATRDDLPALRVFDSRAFGFTWGEPDFAGFEPLFEPERFVLAHEPTAPGLAASDALVGAAGAYSMTMTVPGGARLPVPGVTWVGVALHQRRRGLLRRLFADLHAGLVADGAALAALTASEATIYGRFGYGAATTNRSVRVDRRRARLTPAAEALAGAEVARHATASAVRGHLADVHERWCAATPGAMARSAAWWDWLLADTPDQRSGGSELFVLVHSDGYATYRVADDGARARVVDVVAATPAAHAALWRSLLALDLVEEVTVGRAVPLDDPLPHLLVDPAVVTTTAVEDGVWGAPPRRPGGPGRPHVRVRGRRGPRGRRWRRPRRRRRLRPRPPARGPGRRGVHPHRRRARRPPRRRRAGGHLPRRHAAGAAGARRPRGGRRAGRPGEARGRAAGRARAPVRHLLLTSVRSCRGGQ